MKHTGKQYKNLKRRIGIMLVSLAVTLSMMPVFAVAEEAAPAEEIGGLELVKPDVELGEPDELLDQFFDVRIAEESGTSQASAAEPESGQMQKKARMATRQSILTSEEQGVYDKLKLEIQKIASGESSKAYAEVPGVSSTVDYQLVINTLIADMPYEMYWYDKTIGYLFGNGQVVGRPGYTVFYFSVSKDYWDENVTEHGVKCGLDASKTSRTKAAIDNAAAMIGGCAQDSDLGKLVTYAMDICELASYNGAAVDISNAYYAAVEAGRYAAPFYGDPWQLIYVFDGDENTSVVCEGYAKAFQYVCDKTSFSDNSIECHTVSGELMSGSVSLGGHMWNILHMGNGGNYMVDLTNCDKGSYGVTTYFLRGYSAGNVEDGYTFSNLTFIYDDETASGYYDQKGRFHRALFSEKELTLSDSDYPTDGSEPPVTHFAAKEMTCSATGNTEYWMRLGFYYADEACTKPLSYRDAVIKASHAWSGWALTASPKCAANGSERRKCSRCGRVETRAIPATGHSWYTSEDSLDYIRQNCVSCSSTRKISKVVVDLPKVTIKTPAKAKKALTVKWKKVSSKNRKKISGIEIQYSTSKKFTDAKSKVVKAKKTAVSKKIKKLKSKKKYYVRVRAYRNINGKKHVSKWSKVKSIKTR